LKILEDGKTSYVHGLAELILQNGYTTENNPLLKIMSIKIPISFFA
jgi:hypothetical protein